MTALKMKALFAAVVVVVALAVQIAGVSAEDGHLEASKSECCTANPPTLNASSGSGKVEDLGGLSTYISGSANAKAAVIVVSDIHGYNALHLRDITDKVGRAGYYAVAPDLFHGSWWVTGGSWSAWNAEHTPDKGSEDAKPLIEALKSKGFAKIGGVGFCWGGKVIVKLITDPLIQTGVLIHPSHTTLPDIQGIKAPVSILAAENDNITKLELVKQFETALKANKPQVESSVKIFPNEAHGWALKYDPANATALKSAEEAHKDMLDWLNAHLT